jgi:excisionase family DNA binding protein
MMDQDPWLTVEQIAERLQFHPDTVRRLLREGRIRGTKLRTNRAGWRIRASEIDRYIMDEAAEQTGAVQSDQP